MIRARMLSMLKIIVSFGVRSYNDVEMVKTNDTTEELATTQGKTNVMMLLNINTRE